MSSRYQYSKLRKDTKTISNNYYDKFTEVEKRNRDIINKLRDRKLFAKSNCRSVRVPTTNTVSTLDNDTQIKSYFDGRIASRISKLTSRGDSAIIRLNACIAVYNKNLTINTK